MTEMKKCPKCGVLLSLKDFHKSKATRDGYTCWCKKCRDKAARAYYEKNRKRTTTEIPDKKYCPGCKEVRSSVNFHRDKARKDGLVYRCKQCSNAALRNCREKNRKQRVIKIPKEKCCPECKITLSSEKFDKNGFLKDGLNYYCKKCRKKQDKKNRPQINQYIRERKATNINFRLSLNLRNRLNQAIRNNQKVGSAVKDLGCTIEKFREHIEKQFVEGMSWTNWAHDTWHLDHIKPLSQFDLADRKQFLEACHYTNMQPMWASDNLSKGAKYDSNEHR